MSARLCHCRQCGPGGRRLGATEFQAHRVLQNRQAALALMPSEDNLAEPASSDLPPPPVRSFQPVQICKGSDRPPHHSAARRWLYKAEAELSQRNVSVLKEQLRSHSFRFLDQPQGKTRSDTFINPAVLSLDEDAPCNNAVVAHEQWLAAEYTTGASYLEGCVGDSTLSQELSLMVQRLGRDRDQLSSMKRAEWERQLCVSAEANQVDPGRVFLFFDVCSPLLASWIGQYMESPFSRMEPWAALCYVLVLSLYLLSGVSQKQCAFYLSLLKVQLDILDMPSTTASLTTSLPATIETVIE